MKIFAISDLHLSINNPKPMDIFGPAWTDYVDKIIADWKEKVTDEDVVILAGDFSWAMKLEDAKADFDLIATLPGKKIMIRGNHDYWWQSIGKVRAQLPENFFCLQNDAIKIGNYVFCGSRGWLIPEGKDNTDYNKSIYARELLRLQMSLDAGKKLQDENDKLIYISHYPPFNIKIESNEMTQILDAYRVDKVIFGHLHSYINPKMYYNNIKGIDYYLTSCDAIGNKLMLID